MIRRTAKAAFGICVAMKPPNVFKSMRNQNHNHKKVSTFTTASTIEIPAPRSRVIEQVIWRLLLRAHISNSEAVRTQHCAS